MDIIIGREPGVQQPRLQVSCDGKKFFLGTPGSVGMKVSRQHCRLNITSDGKILSITDITDNNFMYINGKEYKTKQKISVSDIVELGPDKYKLELSAVLKAVIGTPTYHIAPLRMIYDDYQKKLMEMQIQQGKMGALSSLPMILTMGSGALAALIPGITPTIRTVLILIAVLLMIFFICLRIKSASANPQKRKELDDDFHTKYVCPNPDCRHFLGSMRPDELLTNKTCPWCKSKFVE